MASSLFSQPSDGGIFSRINAIKGMLGGNPQAAYDHMMRTNPQFAAFVRDNRGKSPEQIARENGIDYDSVLRAMG